MNKQTATIPDYQLARNEAKTLFESLGISTAVSAPMPDDKDGWPNILYRLTFSKACGRSLETEYRLGVGHVKIPKTEPLMVLNLSTNEKSALYALQRNPAAQFKNKRLHASLAAKLAKLQKVSPEPFDVFACLCDDACGAHNESWENWAANFGYDPDSIKAKAIYDHCAALFHKLTALCPAQTVAKLAGLHSQF